MYYSIFTKDGYSLGAYEGENETGAVRAMIADAGSDLSEADAWPVHFRVVACPTWGRELDSLDVLAEAMRADDPRVYHGADWSSDLPTFGGEEPMDTAGVWSWDVARLLVGNNAEDVRLIPRPAGLVEP